MREILFRGKKSNGDWVAGDLITKSIHHDCCILENGVINHSVDRKSVGQFIGMVDKKGIKIFEGDIISFYQTNIGVVQVWEGEGMWILKTKEGGVFTFRTAQHTFEIIGNIFDNPDLIAA